MLGRLYIEEGERPTRMIELAGAVTIGRTADNDIVLESDGVSHCHAMLLAQPDGVTLLDLGSTFGGGPVPCAAALATIDVIEREHLIENAMHMGEYLARGARAIGVRKVSGRGLLLGLHLDRPAATVQNKLFQQRILTGTASDPNVLRLLPSLAFSRDEADMLLGGIQEALR